MEKIETAFSILDETVEILKKSLDLPFFDAYIESVGNVVDDYQVRVIDGEPKKDIIDQLAAKYQELKALNLTPAQWRNVSQLVLLKGSHAEPLQPNHQLTPDSIGFIFVFIIKSLYAEKQLRMLDIAAGMGNLLLTMAVSLQEVGYQITGFGVDVDDTLLEVAAAATDLCKANIQYFHQDGLQNLMIDPVDVVFSDLPIGYYPNDEQAEKFKTAAESGHSYAHHLLMEQAMKYVKEAGYGLFLLPTKFIESEQGHYLKDWLSTEIYLQGMIQLPAEFFKTESSRKSIVLLQRRGGAAKQAKEVLLANLGSFKDEKNMAAFLATFTDWQAENL